MKNDMKAGDARLREEAAEWFACMRGPEADARRTQFEAWLACDPRHRNAYNSIGETFSLGKALRGLPEGAVPASRQPAQSRWNAPFKAGGALILAAIMAFAILITTTMVLRAVGHGRLVPPTAQSTQRQMLATARGEVRAFTLADGSRLTLDTDSSVVVSLSAERRDFALTRGRVRFAVAHEPRPFVVAAAGGTVVARGTVFDIRLVGDNRAVIDLIEGKVDVRQNQPAAKGSAQEAAREGRLPVTRLVAGHSLAFGAVLSRQPAVPVVVADWPAGLRDFRAVRLGDLILDANRYAGEPLVLGSRDLAELQVSGTFSIRDTRQLAHNLADLLGLAAREEGGRIVLDRPR